LPAETLGKEHQPMASALSAVANATAVFKVATTGVYTDPATGNVLPADKDVTVTLFLKATTVNEVVYPGVNQTTTIYEGYAVSPTAFDPAIGVLSTGTLTFAGESPVPFEVLSLRTPYGKTGLIGTILNSTLGESIKLVARKQD
jgi:hypothetical protein